MVAIIKVGKSTKTHTNEYRSYRTPKGWQWLPKANLYQIFQETGFSTLKTLYRYQDNASTFCRK